MAYKVDTNRKTIKKKVEEINKTVTEIKKYKTVVLLDLKALPDALFQYLRKQIRDKNGKVLVLKKAVLSRVVQTMPSLAKAAGGCDRPMALILSNNSPYEMNMFFMEHRKKRAAKVGDITTSEIVVPEGETDLPPGPVLSELKAAGLNVQIKAGKIAVTKDSMLAKSGEKLTVQKVKALQSLGIMPFENMAKFIVGFDGHYVYTKELLDGAQRIPEDLSTCLHDALNVSLNLSYPTGQNIMILLESAVRQSINVSLNGNLYSSNSIEQLLVSALRQGTALDNLGKK